MHPLGCFGSSLAFAPDTAVCQGCAARDECGAIVEARRPQWLRLLSRFTDASGEKVAVAWLTRQERKKLKANRKAAALAEAERATYGDSASVWSLKAKLDNRSHGLVDQLTMDRIDPRVASLETMSAFSKAMATVVTMLQSKPRTMRELTEALALQCDYSASTAQREAYSLVSILTVCDRAKRVGPSVELS